MINFTTKSGKYRVEQNESGHMRIWRNEELWIDNPIMSKLLIELICELEELRDKK